MRVDDATVVVLFLFLLHRFFSCLRKIKNLMKPNTAISKTIQMKTADTLIPRLADMLLVKDRCAVL
jgi:hypothetical protein